MWVSIDSDKIRLHSNLKCSLITHKHIVNAKQLYSHLQTSASKRELYHSSITLILIWKYEQLSYCRNYKTPLTVQWKEFNWMTSWKTPETSRTRSWYGEVFQPQTVPVRNLSLISYITSRQLPLFWLVASTIKWRWWWCE